MILPRKVIRLVSCLLIVALTCLSVPQHGARAAMVSTERVIETASRNAPESTAATAETRERIRVLLQREAVRAALADHGVDPQEALARVDSLTDREVAAIGGQLDRLPAGGEEALIALIFLTLVGVLVIIIAGIALLVWAISD